MNLFQLATAVMVATFALMAWSFYEGAGIDVAFQFLLGASVALMVRRQAEIRAAKKRDAATIDRPHE